MLLHTQRQGLHALQNLERSRWTHASPEIAGTFFSGTADKSGWTEFFDKVHVVKAGIRLCHRRKFSRFQPVESTAINQQATNDHAVATEKLGGGVKNYVRIKIERATEIRCRESGINH